MLTTETYDYQDDSQTLKGYVACDASHTNTRPVVLVAHDWSGCNDFARKKADRLAELGYVGFAIDMYGNGQLGKTKEEKSLLIQPFLHDRQRLQRRVQAAFLAAKQIPQADASKIAAIGFCFGGMCVLDLARSGAEVNGVVSFHGLLQSPQTTSDKKILAKVLALHGYNDPMVTPDIVNAFANEMTHANVDWQLHMYGNAMHAFTNPEANDPAFGTLYEKTADFRSWQAMKDFLSEIW